jgi:hypothetical protein
MNETVRSKGVKKHLRGMGNAQARNDDMVCQCMRPGYLFQLSAHQYQILLFAFTAAHVTRLLHVHFHIITSFQ